MSNYSPFATAPENSCRCRFVSQTASMFLFFFLLLFFSCYFKDLFCIIFFLSFIECFVANRLLSIFFVWLFEVHYKQFVLCLQWTFESIHTLQFISIRNKNQHFNAQFIYFFLFFSFFLLKCQCTRFKVIEKHLSFAWSIFTQFWISIFPNKQTKKMRKSFRFFFISLIK